MAKAPPVPQNSPASSSTPTRESPPPPAAARQAVPPLSALDLNAAEVAALERLPGLGPVLARRIVADREAHGAFRVPEDLLRVPGVGEKRLARIRPLVRTEERP
ncbi:MAG: helix-hairpin-helix domain-containing protein [candidate division NC10 bacterium]|nr:helix-hairpin-helix domain-containing protein [candidate division NC10 bacterium]